MDPMYSLTRPNDPALLLRLALTDPLELVKLGRNDPTQLLRIVGDCSQYAIPVSIGLSALALKIVPVTGGFLALGSMGAMQKVSMVILKKLFPRERPEPLIPGKINAEDQESFPSGHAGGAFLGLGYAVGLFGLNSSVTITTLALATLTASSRYLSKRHWASDIIAGGSIGLINGLIGTILAKGICNF